MEKAQPRGFKCNSIKENVGEDVLSNFMEGFGKGFVLEHAKHHDKRIHDGHQKHSRSHVEGGVADFEEVIIAMG